jgi:hypothetical protein
VRTGAPGFRPRSESGTVAAKHVAAAPHDVIAFLVPGLVHQFGNLLFTIQGHAVTLDVDTLTRAKSVLASTCERGAAGLRILRVMLGESFSWHAEARNAAATLGELLRIPVREAGHVLDMRAATEDLGTIEVSGFARFVVGAIHGLIEAMPAGAAGNLRVTLARESAALGSSAITAATISVAVAFQPAPGSLPFPLPVAEASRRLTELLRRAGHRTDVRALASGLEGRWPVVAGVAEA